VAAICSRDATSATEAAREYGGSAYTDYSSLCADPDVDAVVICTPHHLHFPMSETALRAGKLVVCEKPLALSALDAEELARLAATTGLATAVNFTYHSLPGHRLVARLLNDGAIGTLHHLELSYWQARQGIPGAPPGDAMLDIGSHLLDLATWWCDAVGAGGIESIGAQDDRGAERGARIWTALARTTNGAMVTIAADRMAAGWRNGMVGRMVGDAGCLTLTFDTDVVDVQLARFGDGAAEGIPRVQPIPADLAVGYREFPSYHIDRIVAALNGNGDFPDFSYGLRIQRLIDASGVACRTRSWVDLNLSETT
jgi:predicted dehydrogenase